MTTLEIKNLIKLYIELDETNLESVQALDFIDDFPNSLDYIREMIKNTESMLDILKIVERSLQN